MHKTIINYMRSGAPGIAIVSTDIKRAVTILKTACEQSKRKLYYWSFSTGVTLIEEKEASKVTDVPVADPEAMLKFVIESVTQRSTMVIQDAHIMFEGDKDIALIDTFRNVLSHCKKSKKTIIFLGCEYAVPLELAKEFQLVELDLPNREELTEIVKTMAGENNGLSNADINAAADAGAGMSQVEFENAVALSMVEVKKASFEVIQREKSQMLKKSGVLELVNCSEGLANIGGLEKLKTWMKSRACAFGPEAREYGLPMPKGILIVGVPGTGKSLTAKATANILKRPLIKLDVSKVFAGIVGSSERNMREAQAMAEAMAPCVLMIDEVEKAFSGTKSSNATDGGTSSRVFGSFIHWMQERKSPVFIVATANDVTQLPPEFLRKGRFDDLFFVDLPDQSERTDIWKIQLVKYRRDPKKFDVVMLAKLCDGFTGAEIEQLLIDGMYHAFADKREVVVADIMQQHKEMVPLSKTMPEQVKAIQDWGRTKARFANSRDAIEAFAEKAESGNGQKALPWSITAEPSEPF